jgi:predicted nucleic acid-binding protein
MFVPMVVLDANVLFPAPLRDLLLRLSHARLFRVAWSEYILDETFMAVQRARPNLDSTRLQRTRNLMNLAFPEAMTPPGSLDGYSLPDINDRHVLMTAVLSGSEQILTFNLKDFPLLATRPHGIVAVHPDEFLCELSDGQLLTIARVLAEQLADLRRGNVSMRTLLDRLERNGIPRTVALLRDVLDV